LTVNNCDQMNRAGRFLYLDWAQSHLLKHERDRTGEWERVTAQHVGYNRLGVTHRRTLTARKHGTWHIEDSVFSSDKNLEKKNSPFAVDLLWLIPDWPWEVIGFEQEQSPENHGNSNDSVLNEIPNSRWKFGLNLLSPEGRIQLVISSDGTGFPLEVQIVRAGDLVYGTGDVSPTWGWISPTYGQKIPGISLRVKQTGDLPINFTSLWTLPELEE
jgi:hypothetical protein